MRPFAALYKDWLPLVLAEALDRSGAGCLFKYTRMDKAGGGLFIFLDRAAPSAIQLAKFLSRLSLVKCSRRSHRRAAMDLFDVFNDSCLYL